ncbi:DUF1515 family protein [Ensifer adhaerens]|uniref:DUF1515 family protein n=1 Tax=Ensifer adhaerens TaxID=106592 RepID=UPI000CF11A89|nr:DUF1515 family protein [Ensifer adhaerens]
MSGHLEASTATLAADVAEMKPVTDDVKRRKLMGIGALGVTGIAAMARGVGVAEAIRRIAFVILGKGWPGNPKRPRLSNGAKGCVATGSISVGTEQ